MTYSEKIRQPTDRRSGDTSFDAAATDVDMLDLDAVDFAILRGELPALAERVEGWCKMGIGHELMRRRVIEAGVSEAIANLVRSSARHLNQLREIEQLHDIPSSDDITTVMVHDAKRMLLLIDSHIRALRRWSDGDNMAIKLWVDRRDRFEKHVREMVQRKRGGD